MNSPVAGRSVLYAGAARQRLNDSYTAGLRHTRCVTPSPSYAGQPFAQGVREALREHVMVQIAKRSELHRFEVMPQRWVVEPSFAWLEKSRR